MLCTCVCMSVCLLGTAGQDMSTPASVDSSLCWREESILTGSRGAAATPTTLRGWCPSAPSAPLWASVSLFRVKKAPYLTHQIDSLGIRTAVSNVTSLQSNLYQLLVAAKNRLKCCVNLCTIRIWTPHTNLMKIWKTRRLYLTSPNWSL